MISDNSDYSLNSAISLITSAQADYKQHIWQKRNTIQNLNHKVLQSQSQEYRRFTEQKLRNLASSNQLMSEKLSEAQMEIASLKEELACSEAEKNKANHIIGSLLRKLQIK